MCITLASRHTTRRPSHLHAHTVAISPPAQPIDDDDDDDDDEATAAAAAAAAAATTTTTTTPTTTATTTMLAAAVAVMSHIVRVTNVTSYAPSARRVS